MKILYKYAAKAIQGLLYLLSVDHRKCHYVSEHNFKKFTHTDKVDFKSNFGRAKNAFRTVPYEVFELKTKNYSLLCADKHRVIDENYNEVWVEDLVKGSRIRTDSGVEEVKSVRSLGVQAHMYCLEVETDRKNDPNNHLFYTNGILSHNTTCAAAYLLWRAMFNDDTTILIAANKYVQALEIMDRIRYAYEHLPDHIRAGVTEYNKGTISFDNGSRIISRATSPDAGRGLSISLLYLDEFAFVMPNKASEFWTSISPTLATGGGCIITSTPKSDEDQFAQIWKAAIDNTDEFGNVKEDGTGKNNFFALKVSWDHHPDRDEEWAETQKNILGEARFRQEFACVSKDTTINVENLEDAPKKMAIGDLFHLLDMVEQGYTIK